MSPSERLLIHQKYNDILPFNTLPSPTDWVIGELARA